ncbi:MAG: thiamine pyrophosphate-binding protein [Lachnospiraceae bacterium]|nr:thiamine pyrophosphate-binding protein [Lachnospiraceae bacterium]
MIKLSDYVFKFLESKGTEHVFMLPGGGAMHLDDSLGKSNLEYTCFLHEQAAAIAAEAYGQHTNKPGVVLVTSGPGATNAITGVTAGWIDSTPMIVISGQSKRADLVGDKGVRQIGSQEVQIVPMVTAITKYAVQILEPTEIRYHLERAYHEASTGRPGPVWLDIPLDVQAVMLNENELEGYTVESAKEVFIEKEIEQIIELLGKSEKPLVLAGNGVKLAEGTDLLYQLLDILNIPVETTWKTIDMFAENEKNYVGHPGIMGDRGANLILQESDLILSIGCRLDTSVTAFNDKNFGKNAKKIVVDIDNNEIKRMGIDKEVAVTCDAKLFLQKLLSRVEVDSGKVLTVTKLEEWKQWMKYCTALRAKYPVVTEEHRNAKDYVSAYYFIEKLCELLKEDDIIVPESSGGAGEITYQAFRLKKGQKMKNAAGLGSMGFGLPYAIGSCIANEKRRTILINGDGAFQLNIQELETLHRLKLPVKMFIWNNDGYASIRSMQRNNFESHYVASDKDSGLTMPDIGAVAEAYGFEKCRICNNKEVDELLPEIMMDDRPLLCEIMVLPEETVSPRVKAIVGENGKMTSGPLEKMWPYIDEG